MGDGNTTQDSSSYSPVPPILAVRYMRIMLLDAEERNVLMQRMHDRWDLPNMVLPWGFNGDVQTCCEKFQSLLGYQTEELMFTGITELLGQIGCDHPPGECPGEGEPRNVGYAKLLLIEPRADLPAMKELPAGFEWKNADFVSSIEHDRKYDPVTEYAYRPVICVLKREPPLHALLPHPPFQKGWFQKASDWLLTEVIRDGAFPTCNPVQFRVSHSSAIVAVYSTNGPFFLKGVPPGSHEIEITANAAKLFPNCIPDVVSVSEELRSFITRGFDERKSVYEEEDRIKMLGALGKIQRESVEHVKHLIDAGVPALRVEDLEETLNAWAEDEMFASAIHARVSDFKEIIPILVTMVKELRTYHLPMCLVHGDFGQRNTGYKVLEDGSEHMIVHDWQFGCISHPFFEFHDFREDWSGLIDIYLEIWSDYESLERTREAYKICKVLGWLLKLRGLLDCVSPEEPPRRFGMPVSDSFFIHCFIFMERDVREWAEETHND